MDIMWSWITGAFLLAFLLYRTFRPSKKVTFERATFAVKSAPLILDHTWTVPSFVASRYPKNSQRVDNGVISIIYSIEKQQDGLFELIDMSMRGIGQGGLIIRYLNGDPTSWGRFGDNFIFPGVDTGDATYAKVILEEVKAALTKYSPN